MSIFKYHATNVWRAFLLNSIVSALTILIALIIKGKLDTYEDEKGHKIIHKTNAISIGLTLVIAFITSFMAYSLMHVLFGFGGGMTSSS